MIKKYENKEKLFFIFRDDEKKYELSKNQKSLSLFIMVYV
jgi:hypothetical protein